MLPKPERVWPHCFFPDGYQKGTVLKKKRQSPVHRAGAAPFLALLWTVQASQNLTEFRMLAIGLVGLHTGEPGCLEGYHVHIWRGTLGDCHCILPCSGSGVRVISPLPLNTHKDFCFGISHKKMETYPDCFISIRKSLGLEKTIRVEPHTQGLMQECCESQPARSTKQDPASQNHNQTKPTK